MQPFNKQPGQKIRRISRGNFWTLAFDDKWVITEVWRDISHVLLWVDLNLYIYNHV